MNAFEFFLELTLAIILGSLFKFSLEFVRTQFSSQEKQSASKNHKGLIPNPDMEKVNKEEAETKPLQGHTQANITRNETEEVNKDNASVKDASSDKKLESRNESMNQDKLDEQESNIDGTFQQKIDALEADIPGKPKQLEELQSNMKSIFQKMLKEQETNIARQFQEKISIFQKRLEEQESNKVRKVHEELNTLRSEIIGQKKQLEEQQSKIKTLKSEIIGKQKQIEEKKSKIITLQSEITSKQKELELEKKLSMTNSRLKEQDTNIAGKLQELQENINELQEKFLCKQKQLEEQIGELRKIFKILVVKEKGVCIVSRSPARLQEATALLNSWLKKNKLFQEYELQQKHVATTADFHSDDFQNAKNILLVAIREGRGLLISEDEESQLGDIYKVAKKENLNICMLYMEETSNATKDLYHKQLEGLVDAQSAVRGLAGDQRFLSIPALKKAPEFNEKQGDALKKWLKGKTN